ncbi:alpha-galactosidase [Mrakia frigida]|uniref:glycoside hydrolase family 27 protein n=1 Tax=Mrakia frigida TaxID=29902 RepID=UPI003FCC0FEB
MSLLALLLATTLAAPALAHNNAPPMISYNGLAAVPQMGWNTWNQFACNISEEIIVAAAQTLVSSGLADLGYDHVLIDDCWHAPTRDADGRPQVDEEKFPRGMKVLVDEIHAMGLKAGIYSSSGTHTCGLQFGSLDYEEIDAETYADWGFDYLKYDNCFNSGRYGTPLISFNRYKVMSDALLAASERTGRPIFYSLCSWGEDGVANWGATISNSWRATGDIEDKFDGESDDCPVTADSVNPPGYFCSVSNIVEKAVHVLQKVVRGSWADLDMLEVGRGGMSTDQYIVHFSLWAMMKSPLILGNDLTIMDDTTKAILSNKAVIAVNQHPDGAGRPARRVQGKQGELQVWKGDLEKGAYVVAVVNWTDEDVTVDVALKTIFKFDAPSLRSSHFTTEDLWAAPHYPFAGLTTDFGANEIPTIVTEDLVGVQVRKHGARVWKFVMKDENERRAEEEGRRERVKQEL